MAKQRAPVKSPRQTKTALPSQSEIDATVTHLVGSFRMYLDLLIRLAAAASEREK